jgi:hemoglobin-like flavoprotein
MSDTLKDAGATLVRTLELYVDQAGDPGMAIYRRFFARYPEAEAMFGFDEEDWLKLRMMDRVFSLLLEIAEGTLNPQFSAYWVTDHVAWEIDLPMVQAMFEVIVETIREGVGNDWTNEMDEAWAAVIGAMMPHIANDVKACEDVETRVPGLSTRRDALLAERAGSRPAV